MSCNSKYGHKKKELIGPFYRAWKTYATWNINSYDHDFPNFAEWVVVPHGIYDVIENKWFMTLWTSKDTAEFAKDCFITWWENYWKYRYKDAPYLLILCDGWWSNWSRSYLFKFNLEELAEIIGKEIRIAHYPPYSSKRNPIEHRMFCHVSRVCSWIPFTNMEVVKSVMSRTSTKTWLSVQVVILDAQYETGKAYLRNYIQTMRIQKDDYLPKRNYKICPKS